MTSLLPHLHDILIDFAYSIFPNLCLMCEENQRLNNDIICIVCKSKLPYTDHFIIHNNRALEHFAGRVKIENAASLLNYYPNSQIKNLLYKLKYKNQPSIGVHLGSEIGHKLIKTSWYSDIDFIIPVPIHKKKLIIRKYNQAEKIAYGITNSTDLITHNDILIKLTNTSSQTNLSRQQRMQNVKDSFSIINSSKIKDKHALLIDDVLTTGATLEVLAKLLLNNGAKKVSIVTMAIAIS